MHQVSLRRLHHETGAIVRLAAEGHVVAVLERGTPIAEIRQFSEDRAVATLPDRRALLARFPRVAGDSGRFLEQDRR